MATDRCRAVKADPEDGLFIVRAELVANDGTRYVGYVSPNPEFDLGYVQPTIVTNEGQVTFWYGSVPPRPGEIDRSYALLGKERDDLFPVKFRALVPHGSTKLKGEVPAFLYMKGPRNEVVEVK